MRLPRLPLLARLPLLPLFAFLAACPVEGDDDDSAAGAPRATEVWLAGEQTVTTAGGTTLAPQRSLVRRRTDPADSSLVEEVVQENGQGGVDHFVLTGTIDAEAGTYTFAFDDDYGRLEGEGTLEGTPWEWTAWSSRSEYVTGPYEGSYVTSDDALDDEGLTASKAVYDPDDVLEVTIDERLLRAAERDWNDEAEELLAR